MPTYSVAIVYNKHSSYLAGRDTLDAALSEATKMREYYDALYPGTVKAEFSIACEKCNGRGRTIKGRRNVRFPKYVDCACCRGRGFFPLPIVG